MYVCCDTWVGCVERREPSVTFWVLGQSFTFSLNALNQLSGLASEPQRLACVSLFSAVFTSWCCHIWLFKMGSGNWTHTFMLAQNVSDLPSHLHSPNSKGIIKIYWQILISELEAKKQLLFCCKSQEKHCKLLEECKLWLQRYSILVGNKYFIQ